MAKKIKIRTRITSVNISAGIPLVIKISQRSFKRSRTEFDRIFMGDKYSI